MPICPACQNENDGATCARCGAPFGLAPPVMQRRKSRRGLWLALFGLVVAGGAVAAYLFLKGPRADAAEMTRKLPAGMQMVGGANLHRMLSNDWVKRIRDNPAVQMGLDTARNQFGVDLLALDAAVGGIKIDAGKIHSLVILVGTFDREKVEPWLKKASTGEIDVGGQVFQRFGYAEMFIPIDLPAPAGKSTPALTHAPIALGFLDEHTFVAGSPELIESYEKGGGEPEPALKALLDKIDPEAVGWGAGVLVPGIAGAWPLVAPVTAGTLPGGAAGAAFVYQLKLSTSLEVSFELTLPSEAMARTVADALGRGTESATDLLARLAVLGKVTVKPEVAREGATVRMLLSVPLPRHDEVGF